MLQGAGTEPGVQTHLGGDLLPPGPKWYRVRRATCYKSLINVRCLSLKTPDGPNNHSAPDGGLVAARLNGLSRSALTRRRDSEERRAIPEAVYGVLRTPTIGVWS